MAGEKFNDDGSIDYRERRNKAKVSKRTQVEGGGYRVAWMRLPEESDEAWHAFIVFRDMEPEERDFDLLADAHPEVDFDKLEGWIVQHDWDSRIAAWDESYIARRAYKARKAAEKMKNAHASVASGLVALAAKEVTSLMAAQKVKMPLFPADFQRMVGATIALAETGVKLERLSREMATEVTEARNKSEIDIEAGAENLERLSDDDLIKLREIHAKVRSK